MVCFPTVSMNNVVVPVMCFLRTAFSVAVSLLSTKTITFFPLSSSIMPKIQFCLQRLSSSGFLCSTPNQGLSEYLRFRDSRDSRQFEFRRLIFVCHFLSVDTSQCPAKHFYMYFSSSLLPFFRFNREHISAALSPEG